MLVAAGADVNAFDGDKRTPLYYANGPNYTDIVMELLPHSDITNLNSALKMNIVVDNPLIIKKLLSKISINESEYAVMMHSAASLDSVLMVQYLNIDNLIRC
jgi:ankyrin repeat protein